MPECVCVCARRHAIAINRRSCVAGAVLLPSTTTTRPLWGTHTTRTSRCQLCEHKLRYTQMNFNKTRVCAHRPHSVCRRRRRRVCEHHKPPNSSAQTNKQVVGVELTHTHTVRHLRVHASIKTRSVYHAYTHTLSACVCRVCVCDPPVRPLTATRAHTNTPTHSFTQFVHYINGVCALR